MDTRLAKAIAKAETASATFVKKALVAALCSATSDLGYFRLVGGSTTESSGTKQSKKEEPKRNEAKTRHRGKKKANYVERKVGVAFR